jgi:RNA polymerase sigma-70 factor, ECF subfamily
MRCAAAPGQSRFATATRRRGMHVADLPGTVGQALDRWVLAVRADDERVRSTSGASSLDAWEHASDGALVEAARGGHADAFSVLATRYQRMVYRVCARFVATHEDTSDLTQDVFLRAFRALPSYRGQAAFKTWLYRIAVNAGLTRATVGRPEEHELLSDVPAGDAIEQVDTALDRARRAERVRRAVRQLPPRQRAAIVLRVFQDLSHEEAARVLGCSVGTVKANVFHALRKLRTLLQDR